MSIRDEVLKLVSQSNDEALLVNIKRLLEDTVVTKNIAREPENSVKSGKKSEEPIAFFRNKDNNHRMLHVDLDAIAADEDMWEDVYDLLEIERRRCEETVPWEEAKRNLGLGHV